MRLPTPPGTLPRSIARRVLPVLLGPVAAAIAAPAWAQRLNADGGVAIRGTDPVAYFTEGRPVPGRPGITHAWQGATWRFASEANRALFVADPERYAPAYGGFCAFAVSEGRTAPIDPDAWRIVEGRLFLNYNRSIQRQWAQDIPGRVARADTNWPGLARE